jgi:hypothetical protein
MLIKRLRAIFATHANGGPRFSEAAWRDDLERTMLPKGAGLFR